MNLEDEILGTIFKYPCSYQKNSYNNSKLACLELFFLNSNNHKFIRNNGAGYFVSPQDLVPILDNNTKQRMFSEERLVTVYKKVRLRKYNLYALIYGESTLEAPTIEFYKDFIERTKNKRIRSLTNPRLIDEEIKKIESNFYDYFYNEHNDETVKWKPIVLLKRKENSALFDEQNLCLIKKDTIANDWVEGISFFFKEYLNFLETDFNSTREYNWSSHMRHNDYFSLRWQEENRVQMCKEYEIPFSNFVTPKQMAQRIVENERQIYIKVAESILNYYK